MLNEILQTTILELKHIRNEKSNHTGTKYPLNPYKLTHRAKIELVKSRTANMRNSRGELLFTKFKKKEKVKNGENV